jgi:hypothetical protein
VEDAIRGHYAAIGAGDFQKAYSYFCPTIRSQVPQQGWIDSHRADQIRGTTINLLKVNLLVIIGAAFGCGAREGKGGSEEASGRRSGRCS